MSAENISPSQEAKIKALRVKHSAISDELEQVQRSPGVADYYLQQLKKQKLILKDSIERLQKSSAN